MNKHCVEQLSKPFSIAASVCTIRDLYPDNTKIISPPERIELWKEIAPLNDRTVPPTHGKLIISEKALRT